MESEGGNAVSVRRRNVGNTEHQSGQGDSRLPAHSAHTMKEDIDFSESYWLTRIVFIRSLAFIYGVAFLVAYHQNKQLIGDHGLLPARWYFQTLKDHLEDSKFACWFNIPTLLWLAEPWKLLDIWLDVLALSGLTISIIIFMSGASNMITLGSLWIFYHSLVNAGQIWYGFGWESQLLETGFLAIFLVPVVTWRKMPKRLPPPMVAVWGYRWLIIRIMLGAGLIKIRGDQCWLNLTCMNYHYETQPVPNPLSYYLHQLPNFWHAVETMGNHIVELAVPWLGFFPRPYRITCGIVQVLFQVILIISGNLSFLNWLTILPSIWFFDDRCFMVFFQTSTIDKLKQRILAGSEGAIRRGIHHFLGLFIAVLSIPVVINLLSPQQAMNTSFEPFRIVNTYGAFGSITKQRNEVIIQGTSHNLDDPNIEWLEYEFNCKPGDVYRRPCVISPYHYRLDWLMWFAAFQNHYHNPWLIHLMGKLLVNDEGATSLLTHNPFRGKQLPKYMRADLYSYKYAKIGSKEAQKGQWWIRKRLRSYVEPLDVHSTKEFLRRFGLYQRL